MKRKHLFSLSFLSILSLCLTAQTSWTRLTPTPQEATINCMKKIPGTNKLVAVGGGSTIMFSEDNGSSWEMRYNPAGKDNNYVCYSVLFFNGNVGFVSGSKESILKTLDGGLTWTEVYSGSTIYAWSAYFDFVFSDPATGVAVGSMGKILRTTDGGNTWIEVNSGVDFQLNAVDLCLSQKLIAVGADDEHYLVSPDAGLNWEIITVENSMQYGNFSEVKFITSSTGLACISGSSEKVLRTIDAGETWEVVYSGSYSPQAIDNYDDMHIAIGCHREVYESGAIVSYDGGLSWTEFPNGGFSNGACKTVVAISQVPDFIMAGDMGMMYGSDGAGNWEDLYERTFWGDIYQVQFLDQNTGFALAESHQGGIPQSDFMMTNDGGLNWNKLIGAPTYSGAFFALSPLIYMIVDNIEQLIFRMTSDGGLTWDFLNTGFVFDAFCIKFNDINNGLITGEGNVIRTTDSGESWQEVITGSGGWWSYYYDIEYRSAEVVFLAGDKDYYTTFINKSTDGGLTWEGDSIGSYGAGMDLFFADDNTAFVACQNNMILKSTDGGETWSETVLNNIHPIEFRSIHFPSLSTGYAVGDGPFETMLKTTDGGETWNPINAHSSSGLNYVYFSDDNNGLIFGDGGVVLKTNTGGITGFEEPSFSDSGKFMAIYPNPSTDEVNIIINPPLFNNTAQLIIYNSNGEKIETLSISNPMETVTISTGRLKPGIYFCQVKTHSGITETKKMIKL